MRVYKAPLEVQVMLPPAGCDLERGVDRVEDAAASEGLTGNERLMRLIPRSNSPRLGEKHLFHMLNVPVTSG